MGFRQFSFNGMPAGKSNPIRYTWPGRFIKSGRQWPEKKGPAAIMIQML